MKQEGRELLLKDLCARLPYGVKISKANVIYPMTGINIALGYVELAVSERISIEDVKPYLRPMSSMTDEEIEIFNSDFGGIEGGYNSIEIKRIDWLNKKMFDYRGLIPMGLVLEAPEGMYNLKNK